MQPVKAKDSVGHTLHTEDGRNLLAQLFLPVYEFQGAEALVSPFCSGVCISHLQAGGLGTGCRQRACVWKCHVQCSLLHLEATLAADASSRPTFQTDVSLFSACRHLRHTKTMQHAANFRHGVSWLMSTCSVQGCQLMQLPDQVNHHQALAKTPNHITCVFAWVLCLLA